MRSRKSQYYDMFYSFLEQKKNKEVPGFTDTKKIDFLMWVDI